MTRIVIETEPNKFFCGMITENGIVFRTHATPNEDCATEFEDKETADLFREQAVGRVFGTYARVVEIAEEQMAAQHG